MKKSSQRRKAGLKRHTQTAEIHVYANIPFGGCLSSFFISLWIHSFQFSFLTYIGYNTKLNCLVSVVQQGNYALPICATWDCPQFSDKVH